MLDVTVATEVQLALDVITTVIISPFANVLSVKVGAFVPLFTPFTFHWKEGVLPPLVAVAVKLTAVPVQIAPEGRVEMVTAGATTGVTTIVIVLDDADEGTTQIALEVMTTETISPFTNVPEENVGEFVPTFTPFTFH